MKKNIKITEQQAQKILRLSEQFSGSTSGTSTCDTTQTSSCAEQWFGNNPSPSTVTWMASKDCSEYQSILNRLESQYYSIMSSAPNPQQSFNDWDGIKDAANNSGLTQPEKGQFKRKAAKSRYALCMKQTCC